MGLGVFAVAADQGIDLRGAKDGFSSFWHFLPHPRYEKLKLENKKNQ